MLVGQLLSRWRRLEVGLKERLGVRLGRSHWERLGLVASRARCCRSEGLGVRQSERVRQSLLLRADRRGCLLVGLNERLSAMWFR